MNLLEIAQEHQMFPKWGLSHLVKMGRVAGRVGVGELESGDRSEASGTISLAQKPNFSGERVFEGEVNAGIWLPTCFETTQVVVTAWGAVSV